MRGTKITEKRQKSLPFKNRTRRAKIRFLVIAVWVAVFSVPLRQVEAIGCPQVRAVFARGSGGEFGNDANYLAFKNALDSKLSSSGISYEVLDLDYPAIGVGIDNLKVTIEAFVGAGDSYDFGDSVNTGVQNLTNMVNGASCPQTKYLLGGYSQGAMVVSKSLQYLKPERLLYVATFGDPKIYLPEGKGANPIACRGEGLSDYRAYVPDCRAYKGLLGAYIPYRPDSLAGKVGTWCNRHDIFCSTYLSIDDHVSYVSDNLYEDASRVMFHRVVENFELNMRVASEHDTVILIDSSGSMRELIEKYKAEANRLAEETFNSGGRVALFDYRDLDDPYPVHELCNFDTCTKELAHKLINSIEVDGGGDWAESMLSASFNVMKKLNWKYGATKSLVVLTDANFLSPDRDGVTVRDVIQLSKTIDPVNIYIITDPSNESDYKIIADGTDGKVVTNLEELSLLTDFIIERFDSLPRVEEEASSLLRPEIALGDISYSTSNSTTVNFESSSGHTLVMLNGEIIGETADSALVVNDMDCSRKNVLTLAPITDEVRGDSVEVELCKVSDGSGSLGAGQLQIKKMPKTPNTGKR